jgi:hypothetical protein
LEMNEIRRACDVTQQNYIKALNIIDVMLSVPLCSALCSGILSSLLSCSQIFAPSSYLERLCSLSCSVLSSILSSLLSAHQFSLPRLLTLFSALYSLLSAPVDPLPGYP